MKRMICATPALLWMITACGAQERASGDDAVATASYLAALEVNEDGSDIEVADATGDEPRLMPGCSVHAVRAELRHDFDRDGDGDFAAGERKRLHDSFHGPRRGERRMRFELVRESYDVDADGSLDADERAALEADLDARCEQKLAALVERFDADGSGELDAAEWEAVHAEVRARFAENHQQLVERFDADANGELDETERQSAREAIAEELRARHEHMRERADLDGDGTLDPAERDAMREHFSAGPHGPGGGPKCDGGMPPPDGFGGPPESWDGGAPVPTGG